MKKNKAILILTDVLSMYLAVILAVIVRGLIHKREVQTMAEWTAAHAIIFFPSLFFSLLAIYIAGLYDSKTLYDKSKVIPLLIYTQLSTAIFSVMYFYTLRTELTPKLTLFLYIVFSIIILSGLRILLLNLITKSKKQKALLISDDETKLFELRSRIEIDYSGYILETDFINEINKADLYKYLKVKLGDFDSLIYDEKIINKEFFFTLERVKQEKINVYSYTQYYEFLYKKIDLDNFDFDNFKFNLLERKENIGHYLFRRFVDLSCAILIFPIFILSLFPIYILNLFLNKGNLFSVQDRVGYLSQRIWLYKLRTMVKTDRGGISSTSSDADHKLGNTITTFGKLLRVTRLDELSQVMNLIRGDISMIGPRADIIGVHNDMCAYEDNYKYRLMAPQGLTGWAQVHMSIPPRTNKEHRERLAYDLYYIRNRSILLDISIILKTIKTVIAREGA